jgi:hypothetical protein
MECYLMGRTVLNRCELESIFQTNEQRITIHCLQENATARHVTSVSNQSYTIITALDNILCIFPVPRVSFDAEMRSFASLL